MPTLAQKFYIPSGTAGGNTNVLTTAAFSPAAGDVIIVKLGTWDTSVTMGAPTNTGSQTITSRVVVSPAASRTWCAIYSCTVTGTPINMTISSTPTASCMHSMEVEWWTSAVLDATPVTAPANNVSGAPTGSITTTAANSAISVVNIDFNSLSPATRAYVNAASVTEEDILDASPTADSVHYYWRQAVATAGATSFGMTAPAAQRYTMAAIEVKHAGVATVTGSATLSGSGTLAATALDSIPGSLTLSGKGTLSATATDTVPGSSTLAGSGTLSATSVASQVASAALSGVGGLSGTGVMNQLGSVALSGSGTLSPTAINQPTASASLLGSGTLAATAVDTIPGSSSLLGIGTLTATAGGGGATVPGSAALSGTGTLTASGLVVQQAASALSGSGTLAGTALVTLLAGTTLTATGTLTGTALDTLLAGATLTGTGTLTASGTVSPPAATITGSATLRGSGTLLADGTSGPSGLVLNGAVQITGRIGSSFVASFRINGTVSPTGRLSAVLTITTVRINGKPLMTNRLKADKGTV